MASDKTNAAVAHFANCGDMLAEALKTTERELDQSLTVVGAQLDNL